MPYLNTPLTYCFWHCWRGQRKKMQPGGGGREREKMDHRGGERKPWLEGSPASDPFLEARNRMHPTFLKPHNLSWRECRIVLPCHHLLLLFLLSWSFWLQPQSGESVFTSLPCEVPVTLMVLDGLLLSFLLIYWQQIWAGVFPISCYFCHGEQFQVLELWSLSLLFSVSQSFSLFLSPSHTDATNISALPQQLIMADTFLSVLLSAHSFAHLLRLRNFPPRVLHWPGRTGREGKKKTWPWKGGIKTKCNLGLGVTGRKGGTTSTVTCCVCTGRLQP